MKKSSLLSIAMLAACCSAVRGQSYLKESDNLGVIARTRTSSETDTAAWMDTILPENTRRARTDRPVRLSTQWAEYRWQQPVSTREMAVYWWDFGGGVHLPQGYHIDYWNGSSYVPVKLHTVNGKESSSAGISPVNKVTSKISFDEITTTRLRLTIDSTERSLPALQEWSVWKSNAGKDYAPMVIAGADRDVMTNGRTYLLGQIGAAGKVSGISWAKTSGPGAVTFSAPAALTGDASFSQPGDYVLTLTARSGTESAASSLHVKVVTPPPAKRLDVLYTRRYKINSKLWNQRIKSMIVNWIPFCIDQCERTDLATGQGGIDNFIEAGKALHGEPHEKHKGYVFSNAWVHQTVEAMCEALMVDPQGDAEMIAAQQKMQQTLNRWIPIILAAQEPDGYLHTPWTLRDTSRWHQRWSAEESRGFHEGYTAGYFIESAINHYTLTEGRDKRLYDAAKKLADCWVAHIGPGKIAWYDGHQEMEQALVRFGRFVNDMEGHQSHGDSYIKLAKFLLDNRGGGSEYDQSHVPVQQQYEAVGHAVRATYNYSGMADVAAETGDVDYQSAVMSLWDNMVNKKYYVTGGIGSGETSEGFGGNYSLPNDAYCESCSSCGLIFFEYKMNLAYHDAKYADLYEETMYNALLGSMSLNGRDFLYTNPLDASQPRYAWHVCPCCVGNIPRTLLMIPTWTYVRGDNGIYVNLYAGSTIKVDNIAGTDVEMVQQTYYPWAGKVNITVNPVQSKKFTVYVRVPDRTTSQLYTSTPQVKGLNSLTVNGEKVTATVTKGYAAINRVWKKGDKISLDLPLKIQRITADSNIEADSGKVALRYGPLIYSVEKADNADISQAIGSKPLSLLWNEQLLDGVMTINGTWADGSPLLAIPNYARLNRLPVTATPQSTRVLAPARPNEPPRYLPMPPSSVVWIKEDKK